MQSKEDVEKAFREDLKTLLKKYFAGIEVDHYGKDVRMKVIIPAIHIREGFECFREHTEIDLGWWVHESNCC